MVNKRDCKKNNRFYGNKHCGDSRNAASRFFCCYEQDRVETGVHLAQFRLKMHKSQQGFVDFLRKGGYLRISRTTLGRWECGKGKIGDEEIEALCAALGCRRNELVVYRIREIDDERDQLVPLIIPYFYVLTSICSRRYSSFFINQQ